MIKSVLKRAILPTALALTMCLNSLYLPAFAKTATFAREMIGLTRFMSGESILLNTKPIYIPKDPVEQQVQFRGAWISTVFNLDFPSSRNLSVEDYKKEYIKMLDNLESINMNAVIFQVRPKLDAFYNSKINPWSEFLTGTQGKKSSWDPLPWMIAETHNRGMEFHAWFNPYRVTTSSDAKNSKKVILSQLASNNWARKNPSMVFKYDGKLYLNPGEPAVIKHINDSIMEVVRNYDIDAVHFDDYFYPYRSSSAKDAWYAEEERAAYRKHGQAFKDVAAWRRNNVDKLIQTLNKSITAHNKQHKKSVQFGISPFGIWGHYEKYPAGSKAGVGSHTPKTSLSSYDNLYADTRKWVKNNWIDYIAPQIYWAFDEKAAPYGELVSWWANTVKGTKCQLYIGHASYRYVTNGARNISWQNIHEIPNQLKFNSLYNEVKGSAFFSYRSLLKQESPAAGGVVPLERQVNNAFLDVLSTDFFKAPALLPAKPWLDHRATTAPRGLTTELVEEGVKLSWTDAKQNDSAFYVVYRMEEMDGDTNEAPPENIILKRIRRQGDGITHFFVDTTADPEKSYKYSVTAVDRAQNQSKAAELTHVLSAK